MGYQMILTRIYQDQVSFSNRCYKPYILQLNRHFKNNDSANCSYVDDSQIEPAVNKAQPRANEEKVMKETF